MWPDWSAVIAAAPWLALSVALWMFPFTDFGRELAVSGRVAPLGLSGLWVIGVFGLLAGSLFGDMPLLYLLMPVGAIVAMSISGPPPLEYWGFTRGRTRGWQVAFVILIGLAIIVPRDWAMVAWIEMMEAAGMEPMAQPSIAAFPRMDWGQRLVLGLEAVGIAPLVEEPVFTGFLYPWLKHRFGRTGATVVNALIFAAMHRHVTGVPYLALMSVIHVWVFEATGRLGPSVLLHAIGNLMVLVALAVEVG